MTLDMEQKIPVGEEDVSQYLHEIRSYPLLTAEQERSLARRCVQGDEDALRMMVSSNLRLVVSIAREYAGRGVSMMDLVQEGSVGLLAAAAKFDYTLDFRFSTYATKWIRQGISRAVINHSMIRVPVHTAQKMRSVVAARTRIQQDTGREPTTVELAAACDLPPERLEVLLQRMPKICSLDAPVGDEEDALGILLEDPTAEQPYETLVREELNHLMAQLLSTLDERQQRLLRLRYGLEDGKCYSLEQIGSVLGVSKERARQIEQQSMKKLKKNSTTMGLEDFLE